MLLSSNNGEEQKAKHDFPKLYALSKNGSIRVYHIVVSDKGDHAVIITRKKTTLHGKWVEDTYEYFNGVNIGKSNETTYLEQAYLDAKSMFARLLDEGFTENIPNPEERFNTDANGKIKPMLAIPFDESKIIFPCICQPKYDGVRCTISENSDGSISILSRKGKPYNIPHIMQWASTHRQMLPLDGELYNHGELSFQEITSAVKKLSDITGKIKYVVYDRPVSKDTNSDRLNTLIRDFSSIKGECVYLSEWKMCYNMGEIMEYHDFCVDKGYEGAIIRNTCGEYEFGFRSNNLIKLKVFRDSEFKIIDVAEASGRDKETAIFVCKCENGTSFRVKPQGTRELRHEYWLKRKSLIGKSVTVQYQGLSDEGVPRFPSAIAIRDYE